jgi:hypothetical protein
VRRKGSVTATPISKIWEDEVTKAGLYLGSVDDAVSVACCC